MEIQKINNHVKNFGDRLWKNGFIKNWPKPDGMTEPLYEEFSENIKKSFTESLEYGYKNAQEISEAINKEFENVVSKKLSNSNLMKPEPNYVPVRTEPKIGRNDPCTCGSGKKYKKCCGT